MPLKKEESSGSGSWNWLLTFWLSPILVPFSKSLKFYINQNKKLGKLDLDQIKFD